jgi:hypothetical protein
MANQQSTTSRRAVVTSLASAPAMALPVVAASIVPDPVLVAVEAHKQAVAAWEALEEADAHIFEHWERIKHDFPNHIVINRAGYQFLFSHDDVAKHYSALARVGRVPDEDMEHIEALKRSACNRLDAMEARRKAEEDRIGLTDAVERDNKALQARDAAELAVLAAKPTTLAGAAALTGFVRRVLELDELGPLEDEVKVALSNVEAFLSGQGLA